jgi:hypothetical protein
MQNFNVGSAISDRNWGLFSLLQQIFWIFLFAYKIRRYNSLRLPYSKVSIFIQSRDSVVDI